MGADNIYISKVPNKTKVQNVQFHDEITPYLTDIIGEYDETRTKQDTHDATLEDFFRRPLQIAQYEWFVGADIFQQLDPWSLYFENSRVSNRITNFNLLRCRLHLKFMINGNGFLYSLAMASYLPHHLSDSLTTNRNGNLADMVQASQRPHVLLNPTLSTGGELTLPFFHPGNNLRIVDSEWDRMGEITIQSFKPLTHANGGTSPVTITVMAWAEDVQLSVLTNIDTNTLIPQMGEEIDEANKTGMISGPATAISRWATAMSAAPPIAPYMIATSSLASGVAAVAKLFGYSRPPITKAPDPYRPTPISSLATTTTPDTADKLTVDDKQELSIDPRIAGISGHDPMTITSISTRESYITQFDWTLGTAPGTLLWNTRVTPVTWTESGTPLEYRFPACTAATLPFKYWTGSIVYRFRILASSMHKGRLKLTYDPNWVATEEFNTNYTEVIDIAEETDFSMKITNGQDRTYLTYLKPGDDGLTEVYRNTRFVGPAARESCNGTLAITIQQELTTPNSTAANDVAVLVWISTGDDFEVAVPHDHFSYFQYYEQMGEELNPSGLNDDELDKPEDKSSEMIMPTYDGLTNIHSVYFGEAIKSFRPMLKRYNCHTGIGALTNAFRTLGVVSTAMPYLKGPAPNAIHLTSTAAPYNYCNTVLLHWVTLMFSGWRGSIRYKVFPKGNMTTNTANFVLRASRIDFDDVASANRYDYDVSNFPGPVNQSEAGRNVVINPDNARFDPFGHLGTIYRIDKVNPTIEYEVPYYSNYRYSPGKVGDYTGPAVDKYNKDTLHRFSLIFNGSSTTTFAVYTCAGEDFQTYFFTGMPRMYFVRTPPDPVP